MRVELAVLAHGVHDMGQSFDKRLAVDVAHADPFQPLVVGADGGHLIGFGVPTVGMIYGPSGSWYMCYLDFYGVTEPCWSVLTKDT